MTYIIESVGDWGVRTTEYDNLRRTIPHPGDIVDFRDNADYPFQHARFGRVAIVNHLGTGTIHLCCEQGSAFLHESGDVSISGGPFTNVMPDELEPTYKLQPATFWNWGDHLPGAHQGVDYLINRPVFRLKLRTDEDKVRVYIAWVAMTE